MICVLKGHEYRLSNFEDKGLYQELNFIHKIPKTLNSVELETGKDGTTNEEVLKVLIDRLQYLNEKFPCRENSIVITKLEESLMWLNKRTQDRIEFNVKGLAKK